MANPLGAQRSRTIRNLWLLLLVVIGLPLHAQKATSDSSADVRTSSSAPAGDIYPAKPNDEVEQLRAVLRQQQEQIERLSLALESQKQLLERILAANGTSIVTPSDPTQTVRVASAEASTPLSPGPQAADSGDEKIEELKRQTEGVVRLLGGFQFSGDFRFRLDAQHRSANAVAGPLQSIRSRYRLRLNVEKQLDPRFRFHLQLSTGALNNGITNEQDMAGLTAKHPFSIAEAYINYRPHPNLSLRGGRMAEVFADDMHFLWDDDVRFNGFQQILQLPMASAPLGIEKLELRAGEYFLSNPNIEILPASSPFVAAGFQPGQKVRDAMLFHSGFVIQGALGTQWSHQITGDVQIYRYPNQIQLASTPEGVPVLVSNALGIALAGPMPGTGNATTTPGGTRFYAQNFQIVRLAYRLEPKGVSLLGREIPAWLDFQLSRNVGTSRLRDALMVSANLGEVREAGNMRFLYQFAIKDANALIAQFTDDNSGTGSGVNIAVHALRFDLGLTRFLQWQNRLFLQSQRRASNPAERFFVPLSRGANRTYRYQGQLAFSF